MQYRISARVSITDPLERAIRLRRLYGIFEVKTGRVEASEGHTRLAESQSKTDQPLEYTMVPVLSRTDQEGMRNEP